MTDQQIIELAEESIEGLNQILKKYNDGHYPVIPEKRVVEFVMTKEEFDALESSTIEFVRNCHPVLYSAEWKNGKAYYTLYPRGYAPLV